MRKKWIIPLLLLCIVFVVVLPSTAEPKDSGGKNAVVEQYQQPEAPKEPNLLWGFIRLVFSLAFVIFLAYIILRVFGRRLMSIQRGEFIEIIDTLPLGPNRGVYIIEVAGRMLVLGITEQNINLIHEITEPEVLEALQGKKLSLQNNQQSQAFSHFFNMVLKKHDVLSSMPPSAWTVGEEAANLLKDHLNRLKSLQHKIRSPKDDGYEQKD